MKSRAGAVEADPTGFVNGLPERVILDEVQRVPKLFSAIKLAVDRNRQAGRFVLTGSVKVLQTPGLTDSLAGRMAIIRLHPLAQTAQLLNVNKLASSFQLSRNAIQDYLALLSKMFLLEQTPAWHSNRLKRLVKTPKLHLGDTGVACALMNMNSPALALDRRLLGHVLETFVFQELRRQASGDRQPHDFFHFREKDGAAVDIVIQRGVTALAGVEVKAAATVNDADLRGMHKLRAVTGKRFAAGALLYNGDHCLSFDPGIYAVPLSALWESRYWRRHAGSGRSD